MDASEVTVVGSVLLGGAALVIVAKRWRRPAYRAAYRIWLSDPIAQRAGAALAIVAIAVNLATGSIVPGLAFGIVLGVSVALVIGSRRQPSHR